MPISEEYAYARRRDLDVEEWYKMCRVRERRMLDLGMSLGDRFEVTAPLEIAWETNRDNLGNPCFFGRDELAVGTEVMIAEEPRWNEGDFLDVVCTVIGREGRALLDVYEMADATRKTAGKWKSLPMFDCWMK